MEQETKKVSIIIPTYKRAKYIERAIKSILEQTYKNIEIIIVDDNNPDTEDRKNMQKIMQQYKENSKIIYIQHEKNKNGAAARNTGLKIAKGDYITFLDDDDYFLKNRLEILVKSLEEKKEYNAAFTGVIFTTNGKITKKLEAKNPPSEEEALLKLEAFFGTGSNMFFRAEAIKKVGEFDETFLRHQDFEFMVRYFELGEKILAVNKFLVVKTNDNIINRPNIDKLLPIREQYLKKFENNIKKYNEKEIYSKNYMDLLMNVVQNHNLKKYKLIKSKLEKYKKMKIKDKIYLVLVYIYNFKIIQKIRKPYNDAKRSKVMVGIDRDVINEINYIENKNDEV